MGFQAVLRLDLVDSIDAARPGGRIPGTHRSIQDPVQTLPRAAPEPVCALVAAPRRRTWRQGHHPPKRARGVRSSRETSSGSLAPMRSRGVDRQSVEFTQERIAWKEGAQMLTCIDKLTIPNICIEKTAFLVGGETLFSQSIDRRSRTMILKTSYAYARIELPRVLRWC